MMPRLLVMAVLAALSASLCTTDELKPPTVMIAMLVRNKEPYLPYTLTQLSELDYPRDRLAL